MKQLVTITTDKKINGSEPHEKNIWIIQKHYDGTIQQIIDQVNNKYGLIDMKNTDIDDNYACYDSSADGVNYTVDID
jgi:hypothetical protein